MKATQLMKSVVVACAAMVCGTVLGEMTYYVSPNGDESAPTAGFATGYKTISAAVAAATAGDVVLLDKTTFDFTEWVTVKKAITIRGAGESWETVLLGDHKGRGFGVSAAGATLHSFTLSHCGGQWSGCSGVELTGNSVVSNIVVTHGGDQYATNGGTRRPINMTNGKVSHCWITNNLCPNNAGVYISGGTLENCYIANNECRGRDANYYGIIDARGGTIRNCTIVNNKSANYCVYSTTANACFYNNIIWGNTFLTDGIANNWTFAENVTAKNWYGNVTTPLCGTTENGNTDRNPLLLSDGMRFMSDSPCNGGAVTNTAKTTYVAATDIFLKPRGEKPSIGCWEYETGVETGVVIVASAEQVEGPATITLTAKVGKDAATPLTYAWMVDGASAGSTESITLSEGGKHLVSVVVTDGKGQSYSYTYPNQLIVLPKGGFVYYVSPNGDESNPTKGFATGYKTVAAALAAVGAGETVLLDKATFMLPAGLDIDKAITLKGVGENWETVLNGGNENREIKVKCAGALIHNLTLAEFGGMWAGVGAIDMSMASTISNVVVTKCGNKYEATGGTRFPISMTAGLVTHCWITNNLAPNNGGLSTSGGTVENCYIAFNSCRGADAGLEREGIVTVRGGTVRNCTIVHNKSAKSVVYFSSGHFYNNIVWGNTYYSNSTANNWTLVDDKSTTANWYGNCTTPLGGTAENGNIDTNPLLHSDYMHFFSTSPCRGTAVAKYAPASDLDLNERGATPSIGAFEYKAGLVGCLIDTSATTVNQPEKITLWCTFDGDVAEPLTYAWDLRGDGTMTSASARPEIGDIGLYQPKVVVTDANGKQTSATCDKQLCIYSESGAVYVTSKPNPNAQPPYATAETAATSIADVVKYAPIGGEILLDAGTHYLTSRVEINAPLAVRSIEGAEKTFVANVKNSNQLFLLKNENAVVEGISVTNGNFTQNSSGAIILMNAGKVRDCRFIGNAVCGHGGVTAASGSKALIERCLFERNYIAGQGTQGPSCIKTLYMNSVLVSDCLFVCNTNKMTNLSESTPYYHGVAINVDSSGTKVQNCTFVSNVAYSAYAPAVFNCDYKADVRNCIAVDNFCNTNEVCNVLGDDATKLSHSLAWPSEQDFTSFTGMLVTDPLFVDATNGNFRVSNESPVINKGLDGLRTKDERDLDGNSRVVRRHVDMGCYENQNTWGSLFLVK